MAKKASKPPVEVSTPGVNVQRVKLSDLKADPDNARIHGERNKEALKHSLERFGAARSIVIDKDGKVLAGNGTLEAAAAVGIQDAIVIESDGKQLIVVKRPDMSDEEAVAYAIGDNKTTDLSEWNYEQVATQLRWLSDRDPGLLDVTGFLAHEREPLLMASWTPPPIEDIPEDGRPEHGKPINCTKDQREVINRAIERVRKAHGEDVTEGRAIELICGDYLSSIEAHGGSYGT